MSIAKWKSYAYKHNGGVLYDKPCVQDPRNPSPMKPNLTSNHIRSFTSKSLCPTATARAAKRKYPQPPSSKSVNATATKLIIITFQPQPPRAKHCSFTLRAHRSARFDRVGILAPGRSLVATPETIGRERLTQILAFDDVSTIALNDTCHGLRFPTDAFIQAT